MDPLAATETEINWVAHAPVRGLWIRCLKRRGSDAVFKSLMADLQAPSRSAA